MTLHNLKNHKKDYAVCLSISAPLRRGITYTAKKVTLVVVQKKSPCNNFDGGHKAISYFVLKHINILRIHKQMSTHVFLLWLGKKNKKPSRKLTYAFITDFFEALETEEGSQT